MSLFDELVVCSASWFSAYFNVCSRVSMLVCWWVFLLFDPSCLGRLVDEVCFVAVLGLVIVLFLIKV